MPKALAGPTPSEASGSDQLGAPRMLLMESNRDTEVIQHSSELLKIANFGRV